MFAFRLAQFVFEGFWHSAVFSGSFRSSFCRSSGTSFLESGVQHALKFSLCSVACAAREEGPLEASETGSERVYRRCHLASWLAAGWRRNKNFMKRGIVLENIICCFDKIGLKSRRTSSCILVSSSCHLEHCSLTTDEFAEFVNN